MAKATTETNTERERIDRLIKERVKDHRKLEGGAQNSLDVAREYAETKRVLADNKQHVGRFLQAIGRDRMWWSRQTRIGEYEPFQSLSPEQLDYRLPTGFNCLLELTRVRPDEWDQVIESLLPTMTVRAVRKVIENHVEPRDRAARPTAAQQVTTLLEKLAALLERDASVLDALEDHHRSLVRNRIMPVLKDI